MLHSITYSIVQNKVKVSEAKTDVEGMQQSLILDKVKEDFNNFLLEQATNLTKKK